MAYGIVQVNATFGQSMVVNITRASGGVPVAYTDATLATPIALPATISSTTQFFMVAPESYVISVKVNGQESATSQGTTLTSLLPENDVLILAPSPSLSAEVTANSGTYAAVSALGRVKTSAAPILRPQIRAAQTRYAVKRPTMSLTTIPGGVGVTTPLESAYTPNNAWSNAWGPVGFFQYTGPSRWSDYDPYNSGTQGGQTTIEFCTDAPLFAINLVSGSGTWEVYVNDEMIVGPAFGSGALPTAAAYKIFDWSGVRAERRYTLRLSIGIGVISVVTDATDSLWRPQPNTTTDVYMGWMGDSYGQAAATNGLDTMAHLVARMLGYRAIASCVGGTGYDVPTGGPPAIGNVANYQVRAAEFTSLTTNGYRKNLPDLMVLAGGHNTTTNTQAAQQTACAATIAALVSGGLAANRIIVLGVLDQGTTQHAGYANANLGLQAAAVAAGAVWVPNPGWITGTGYATNLKADGNADVLILSDGVHPNQNGVEYLAARIADAIEGAF